jgi:hypothetical protein
MTSTQLNDALSILITTELFEKSYVWSFSMFNSCNENKRSKRKQENNPYDIHSTEPVKKNVVEVLTNDMLGEIIKLFQCFKWSFILVFLIMKLVSTIYTMGSEQEYTSVNFLYIS